MLKKTFKIALLLNLMALSYNTPLWAQSKILSQKTKNTIQTNKVISYNLFEKSSIKNTSIDAAIKNVVYLKLNKEQLTAIYNNKSTAIALNIPTENGIIKVKMANYDIFSDDFQAHTRNNDGTYSNSVRPEGVFYRGFVSQDDYSIAALSFYKQSMGGIISVINEGNYNLVLNSENPGEHNENYILFKDNDIVDGHLYKSICGNDLKQDIEFNKKKGTAGDVSLAETGLSCNTVTVALYGDYKLFLKNQSSVTATENYLTTVFNGNAALYENENIRIALKNMFVNSTNDFYPTNSSNAILEKFGNEVGTNVTGNLMQFITGYTTGPNNNYSPLGGLAWINVLCSTPFFYNYYDTYVGPYSMINTTGNPNLPLVPIYSWDIECSSHEMGHNLGSPHTHSCNWNGNNTAIDGCAPTYNPQYTDGNCAVGPIPTNQGTIMSYCHLLQNVGINLANGFGTQPGDLIRNEVNNASCLDYNLLPEIVTNTSATTVIANAFCVSGNNIYCYNNNNDFDRTNDELILIMRNDNMANVDLTNVEISVTTTAQYNSNSSSTNSNPYAFNYDNWREVNRSWSIKLNNTLSGTTKISLPFLNADITDINGSSTNFNGDATNLKAVIYKTQNAANLPSTATVNDVLIVNNNTNGAVNTWNYNANNPNYKLAEVTFEGNVFGATLGFGNKNTSISNYDVNAKFLDIYPNPATQTVTVSLNENNNKIQAIEILDYLGRSIIKTNNGHQINIASIASGMYIIKCQTTKGNYISKFTKL